MYSTNLELSDEVSTRVKNLRLHDLEILSDAREVCEFAQGESVVAIKV